MADDLGRQGGPRCIALVGPFGSGKTSLLEAIMARTGAISRQGHVRDGNTLGDASPEARANAMSVEANIADTEFMGERYTFIDCPGSVEFQHEAGPVLDGADLAVVVAEADAKKVPSLQLVLRDLEARGVPHMLFLNKIDKLSGRLRDVLTLLQPASSLRLVLRQIPLRDKGLVTGFIDLALERAFVYREGMESEVVAMPSGEQDRELEARFSMLEQVADFDDALLEQLLEDMVPDRELVFADLVREMREGLICPVFLGAAEHGNGITRLLKALRHEAPGLPETRARLGVEDGAGACVQVLKTTHSTRGGKYCVARVLGGEIADGAALQSADGSESKVSGIFRVLGPDTIKRGTATTGETVALGKVEFGRTGETLYLNGGRTAPSRRQLGTAQRPPPVLALAVTPRERRDDVRLSSALARIIEEDPSLQLSQVQSTGETVLEGQGEMHLRVTLERLTGKYGVAVTTSAPHIPYRETIRRAVTKRGRHKKQSGGHGQFGDVVLEIAPLSRGEGNVFRETITGGVVPRQYIGSVEAGVRDYLDHGGPLGFPVVDVAVTLTDGSYHSVDSSDQAFKSAAQLAMREGMPEASPVLLEPIVEITVDCPTEATARINAMLSRRRGQISGSDARADWEGWDEVRAMIPASEIQDLIIELRSATAGVGSFTQRFDHLAELTGRLADEVTEKLGRQAA
jgi:elongation factor G